MIKQSETAELSEAGNYKKSGRLSEINCSDGRHR